MYIYSINVLHNGISQCLKYSDVLSDYTSIDIEIYDGIREVMARHTKYLNTIKFSMDTQLQWS